MRSDESHQRWRVALGSIVIAIGASPIALLLIIFMGIKAPWFLPAVLLVLVVIILVIQVLVHVVPNTVSTSILPFLMPQRTGARAMAYSHVEAMAVRGDTAGASEEFQRLLQLAPEDVPLHRASAEFFSRVDPAKAASIFQRVRTLPLATAEDEHYATHRLIDLYGGPLRNNGRMRVELRRMVERFPGTADAAGAEVALKRLREEADA